MKISNFNKENLKQVRSILAAKFAEIEKETGIKFDVGSIRFGANEFTSKLTGTISNGKDKSEIEKQKWNDNCIFFGLPKDMFGSKISLQGEEFTVSALLTNRPKNCVQIRNTAGKTFMTSGATAKRAFEKTKAVV